MSKPRWRWATRDGYGHLGSDAETRRLWSVKPEGLLYSTGRRNKNGDMTYLPQWGNPPPGWNGPSTRIVTQADFRKRFGRDLRPGERRPLP